VRANDYEDMEEDIIAIDKESLFLMTGKHVFKIPKSFIQGFNRSEVSLNLPALALALEVLKLELNLSLSLTSQFLSLLLSTITEALRINVKRS
jgi:hypothetical protein